MKSMFLVAALTIATAGCVHEHLVAPAASPASSVRTPDPTSRIVADSTHAPLYILNGTVVREVKNLDGLDIVSVEVLKGTAAVAKYGPRAINGVVLITSK
jgi:TonB-dependent SusC/RagA subfamily outer membrane receptor